MATQKVRPDQDRDERQQVQRRQVSRTITIGTLAIAAIVGAIVVLVAVVAVGPEEQTTPRAAVSASGGSSAEGGASSSVTPPPGEAPSVGFTGLPPKDATPSTPIHGDLVKSFETVHLGSPWSAAYLYADGRLIWATSQASTSRSATTWIEQRLTQRGVDFLRSTSTLDFGMLPGSALDQNPGAWEDRKLRPYVPSRYMVVATFDYVLGGGAGPGHPPVKYELPARVQDFLRRGNRIVGSGLKVATDDARTLAEILSESGFKQTSGGLGVIKYTGGRIFGIDINRHNLVIELHPVLPDGRVPSST